MQFWVLGSLAVSGDDGPITVPGAMNRRLLAVLLAARGDVVRTATLVDELWGERPPRDAVAVLRSKISVVRRVLRPAGADLHLRAEGGGYSLRLPPGSSDVEEFESLLARADGGAGEGRAVLLRRALDLWRGDTAFSDFPPEGLCGMAAAAWADRRLAAHESLLDTLLDLGRPDEVATEAAGLVVRYPGRERLRGLQMLALYRQGRQAEALAVYRDVARHLAEEMGIDPSPELAAVHEAILRQSPELRTPARRAAGGHARRPAAVLPSHLTSLVGRQDTLARATAALGWSRLVTLTGPGGVGKTRIAVEVARQLSAEDARDVWFVDLTSVPAASPTGRVARRLVQALGLSEDGGAGLDDVVAGLGVALTGATALLVLDNCEHVVPGVTAVVDELLRAAPGLTLLLTSREPLRVPGEVVVEVPPLVVPSPGVLPTTSQGWPALELFEARARDRVPDFTVGPENVAEVTAICRGVDGLPLGLELVATRLRALSLGDIAARLSDLVHSDGAAAASHGPGRRRTLHSVIAWSWELLTPTEQDGLTRLAVHDGSWTLASAEAVVADAAGPGGVADLVVRLVDKSLVTVAGHVGETRYGIAESVRQFCATRRPVDVDQSCRDAHVAYVAQMLERADDLLRGPDQGSWLVSLDREQPHVDQALARAAETGDARAGLSIAVDAVWHATLRGQHREADRRLRAALAIGRERTDRVTDVLVLVARTWSAALGGMGGEPVPTGALELASVPPADVPERVVLALMRARGLLAVVLPDGAAAVNERCLEAARAHGYRWGEAAALSTRAWNALGVGDLDAVVADATRSRRLFELEGDEWGVLHAGDPLAAAVRARGAVDQARELLEEGLSRARRLELWPKVAFALCELGWLEIDHGRAARAVEHLSEAVRLAARQGAPALQQTAEIGLAVGERRRGDLPRAAARLERWLVWNRQRAWAAGEARVLVELGRLEEARGRSDAAERNYRTACDLATGSGDPALAARALEGMAWAAFARGDRDAAASSLAHGGRTRLQAHAAPTPEDQRRIDELTSLLGSRRPA